MRFVGHAHVGSNPSRRASPSSSSGSAPTARCPTTRCCTRAIVAYASDLTLLDTAVMPHASSWDDDRFMIASLDHAMWFHRPFRADEWLLYHQNSPSAQRRAGFAEGSSSAATAASRSRSHRKGLIRPVR